MNKGNETPSILQRMLGAMLPKRTKRVIFVSSFLAHIQNCQSPDRNLLNKLNTLLNLSNDDKALDLPMRLHSKIWGSVELDKVLEDKKIPISSFDQIVEFEFTTAQIRALSEQIVRATPEFLRYDSNTKMRADLIKVLKNLGVLLQKPTIA